MSGVVRGMAESSVPVRKLVVEGNPAGMNCRGPFALFGVRIGVLSSKRPR